MSALDKLRTGLLTANWKLVSEYYKDMTGEAINVTSDTDEIVSINIEPIIAAYNDLGHVLQEYQSGEIDTASDIEPEPEVEPAPIQPIKEESEENILKAIKEVSPKVANAVADTSKFASNVGPEHGLASGAVNAKKNKTPITPFDEVDKNPKLEEISKKSETSARRPAVESNIITCSNCGKQYDCNKYYRGFRVGKSGTQRVGKCPYCKHEEKLSNES